MGAFYVNYTVKTDDSVSVTLALSGRKACISPAHNGYVVAFDAESENQDQEQIAKLAAHLSLNLHTAVLIVLNHDSDILWYQLCERGELTDEYDSTPGYWSSFVILPPSGGNAQRLCNAFSCKDAVRVEQILRSSGDDYPEATDRHRDLVRALNLSPYAAGFGYQAISQGYFPDGLAASDLKNIG